MTAVLSKKQQITSSKQIRNPTKEMDEYIRENLRYDPETGFLWWIKDSESKSGRRGLDKPVGTYNKGYLHFCLPTPKGKRRQLLVHRVAFFLYYDSWPEEFIDHINNVKTDNRIENLREATLQQNLRNQKSRAGSSSRYKGISFEKRRQKWKVELRYSGKIKYVGYYTSEEEAARAYDKAARELHGDYARLNFPDEHEQGATHGPDL